MERNAVAIQNGYDPTQAKIEFYFGGTVEEPSAFFDGEGETWLWPGPGVRVGGAGCHRRGTGGNAVQGSPRARAANRRRAAVCAAQS